jgi:excisionase family DNA binding protein
MNENSQKLTYTVAEVAKLLGISRATAYEQANSGALPSIKMGRRILIPKMAFERFLQLKTEEFEKHIKKDSSDDHSL